MPSTPEVQAPLFDHHIAVGADEELPAYSNDNQNKSKEVSMSSPSVAGHPANPVSAEGKDQSAKFAYEQRECRSHLENNDSAIKKARCTENAETPRLQRLYNIGSKLIQGESDNVAEGAPKRALERKHQLSRQPPMDQGTRQELEYSKLPKAWLYDQCVIRDQVIKDQEAALIASAKEKSAMRKRLAELEEKIEAQEEIVAIAQQRALGMVDDPGWTPEPDGQLKRELDALDRSIQGWAKGCAIPSLSEWKIEKLSDRELEGLQYDWSGFAVLSEANGEPLLRNFEKSPLRRKACMFLSAWLTYEIYQDIFDNPFFCLEHFMGVVDTGPGSTEAKRIEGGRNERGRLCRNLHDIVRAMLQAHGRNSSQVHLWRSLTLRLLDPQGRSSSLTKEEFSMKEAMQTARMRLAHELADGFLRRAKPFLHIKEPDAVRSSLETIMLKATAMSFQLWTQRSYLDVQGLPSFREHFSITNRKMKPCAFHSQQLDQDERSLEGTKVQLVFHPAVLMRGNSEGSDFTTYRILKQAVVWVA